MRVGEIKIAGIEMPVGDLLVTEIAPQKFWLTPVEKSRLRSLFRLNPGLEGESSLRLLQIVPNEPPDEGPRITVGFVLLRESPEGGRRISFFRIRDHLRRMGMGRRGLSALLDENLRGHAGTEDYRRSCSMICANSRRAPPRRAIRTSCFATFSPASRLSWKESARTSQKSFRSHWLTVQANEELVLRLGERTRRRENGQPVTHCWAWLGGGSTLPSQVAVQFRSIPELPGTMVIVRHRFLANNLQTEEMTAFWENTLDRLTR